MLQVLNDVYQYHLPPIRRIPPSLWARIHNDVSNYLSAREADKTTVFNWYHRQFIEVAKKERSVTCDISCDLLKVQQCIHTPNEKQFCCMPLKATKLFSVTYRYFRNMNKVKFTHSALSEYFLGTWGGGRLKPFQYSALQKQRFGLGGCEAEETEAEDRKVPLQPHFYPRPDGSGIRYHVVTLSTNLWFWFLYLKSTVFRILLIKGIYS